MGKWLINVMAGAALMLSALPAQAMAAGPEGTWIMNNGKVTVRVSYCGGEKLCATIVGLAKPTYKDGTPKIDKHNPNPALRSRRVIGLTIISGMQPAGANHWKGQIYNADDGGTYRSSADLSGDTMVVKGCWGPFCKNMNFKRVN